MAVGTGWGFNDTATALLVAGKSIGHAVHALTLAAFRRLAKLIPELSGGGAIVVPSTDLRFHEGDDDPVYCRVVVGVLAAQAPANAGRAGGPIELSTLRTAVKAAESLPIEIWDAVADELARVSPVHDAATIRRYDPRGLVSKVVLDPSEARSHACEIHLVSTGPLPACELVYGVKYDPQLAEHDLDSAELDKLVEGYSEAGLRYFAGQDMQQERHRLWVKGISVASTNYAGTGSEVIAIDGTAHVERERTLKNEAAPAYWLVPYYD